MINLKAPTGSRLEMTNQYIARVENDIREVVGKDDLEMIVSNIGADAGSLLHLHQQLRPAHRLRPGQPEARSTS